MSAGLMLTRSTMNPDEDFVLHGQATDFWAKPSTFSNSGLTNTTARLSQRTVFNPENYRERTHDRSITNLASNLQHLQHLSREVTDTLNRNVTFIEPPEKLQRGDREPFLGTKVFLTDTVRDSATEEAITDLYEEKVRVETLSGKPATPREAQWYVNPNHLSTTAAIPTLQSVGKTYRDGQKAVTKYSDKDATALEHFPVTLGTAYELCAEEFPQAKSMEFFAPPSLRKSRSKSLSRLQRTQNCKESYDNYDKKQHLEKLYLMTKEAPSINSAEVYRSSPHQIVLGRLRRERLQLEEAKLLELKRLEELERIRGPQVKWYESKGPDFHYESHKNTELVRNSKRFQDLLDYREDLLRASYMNLKLYNKSQYLDC